jgi:hypothetical protein
MKSGDINNRMSQDLNLKKEPPPNPKIAARNRKLGASSQDLSEIDDLDSYGEDGSNGISGGGKGMSKMNFPISSDSNQSKSEEEKKNSTFKNNSFSIEGGNLAIQ